MARIVTVGAAQLGPIAKSESRREVMSRLIQLMEISAQMGVDLIVYPEAALTAFFPHWWIEDENELDSYFEREMPSPATRPLFKAATRHRIGFHLGYCEIAQEAGRKRRFNTSVLVGKDGEFSRLHDLQVVEPGSQRANQPKLTASEQQRPAGEHLGAAILALHRQPSLSSGRRQSGALHPHQQVGDGWKAGHGKNPL